MYMFRAVLMSSPLTLEALPTSLTWFIVVCYSLNEHSLKGLMERVICPMFGLML